MNKKVKLLINNYNACILSGLNKYNIDILLNHIKYIEGIKHKKFFELSFKSKINIDIPLNISLSLLNSKEHKYYGDDYYNLFTIYIYIGREKKLNDQSIGSMSFAIGKKEFFCFNIQRGKLSKACFENNIKYDFYFNKILYKLHRILFYILNYFYINLNKNNIYGFSNKNHPCKNHIGFIGNYDNFYKSYGFQKKGDFYLFNGKKLKNKEFLKYYDININTLNKELEKIIKGSSEVDR